MHFPKKKKQKQNNAVFRRHCFSFSFPWTCNRGREVLFFYSLFLPLSLPPTCFRAEVRRHPSQDEMPEQLCPASDASIGHRCRRHGRAGDVHPMHGRQWDGAGSFPLPCPYKYRPSAEERRGGPKGKKREERTTANGERNRKREKPTERERGTTKTEKPKNRGYRQGNRERQSGRRKKKDKKEKPAGKETPTGVSAQWRRSATAVSGSHLHRHRSAPENNHRHRQLNRPRSPPQVIFFFPPSHRS